MSYDVLMSYDVSIIDVLHAWMDGWIDICMYSSVHSFALRSSPHPLATRTPYVHRVSWSYKSIVYEAFKKANIYIYTFDIIYIIFN